MGPGEAIAAVAFAGVLIGVLIFGSEMFKRFLSYKERQLALTADKTAEKAAQYAAQVERMEQRMRVLERIATDKGVHLADEIEDLRSPELQPLANPAKEIN
jgi:hypothetical protein